MGLIEGWARRSNDRAIANARSATTLAARRRIEAAEVEDYLAARWGLEEAVSAAH